MTRYIGKHRKVSNTSKKQFAGAAALALGASTLGVGASVATASEASAAPQLGSSVAGSSLPPQIAQLQADFDAQLRQAQANGVTALLNARDALVAQAKNLPPQFRTPVVQGIDNFVTAVAPGALQQREAARAPKPAPKPAPKKQAPKKQARPASNPCPASAHACVDIKAQRAWLQRGGNRSYGPVVVSTGRPGQETPRGMFTVTRKVKDEISYEFGNAPMPYAVYFTNNGHAFHQGTTNVQSAGCVRMDRKSAQTFFNYLQPGDKVYIY